MDCFEKFWQSKDGDKKIEILTTKEASAFKVIVGAEVMYESPLLPVSKELAYDMAQRCAVKNFGFNEREFRI